MAEAEQTEQPICRICFADDADDASKPLVSPCKCQGSQKYVHISCLRQWQRSVQLDASNHPEDSQREARHKICGVCRAPFDIPPQDRASMMADLAHVQPEDVAPGLVLVTKATAAESAARSSQLNLMLRAYIEMKAAHFREAVYILTEVREEEAGDGTDVVLGVNLSRALDAPDVEMLIGCPRVEQLLSYERKGVEVRWMNGGPCKPRVVTSLALLKRVAPAERAELLARHGATELVADDQGAVVYGSLAALLALVAEDVALDAAAGGDGGGTGVVLAWAGYAQWSRAQLLGELARGSWGWCRARSADLDASISALETPGSTDSIWSVLRNSDRLIWAPENELSREFGRRHDQALRGVAEVERPGQQPAEGQRRDAGQAAVNAYVQEFEMRRRGAEPRRIIGARVAGADGNGNGGGTGERGGAARACAQQ